MIAKINYGMHRKKTVGYTLIEILVATTLALVILGFTVEVLQRISQNSRRILAVTKDIQIARMVFWLVKRDLSRGAVHVLNPLDIQNLPTGAIRHLSSAHALLFANQVGQIVYWQSGIELHRRELNQDWRKPSAILSNITLFLVQYGELIQKNLVFLSAAKVQNWQDVCAIRFQLRIKSQGVTKPFIFVLPAGDRCNSKALF